MELSISTVVIIVLAMSMLIFGMILLKDIFKGASGAIDNVNKGVINEIDDLFADKGAKLAIAPSTRKISIEQGKGNKGFAFSVRNINNDERTFTFTVEVDNNFGIQTKCKISGREANEWVLIPSGSFTLGPGEKHQLPELITFEIPIDAPICTIPYKISIGGAGESYVNTNVELTIEPM